MDDNEKQLFIKDLEREISLKISALKKEQQAFNNITVIKTLMQDESEKDEVAVILNKLQTLAEKQIAEEIKVYEEVLLELQEIKPNEKDIETEGMVA